MPGASFFELHASSKSLLASQALQYISALYDIKREVKHLSTGDRRWHGWRWRAVQARSSASWAAITGPGAADKASSGWTSARPLSSRSGSCFTQYTLIHRKIA